IHTGPRVDEELASQSADAVARGEDIYFQSDSYLPSQAESRRLLRHELVHVAQQRTGADPEAARMRAVEAALRPDLGPLPAAPGRAQRGACSKSEGQKAYDKLKARHTLTQAEARVVMQAYDDLSDDEQWKMVHEIYSYRAKTPPIQRLLESLSDADRFETYR